MAEPLFIEELISKVLDGQIRIPSFQRGFVWDSERVAHLMDSIFKGYPFGTLLFWRTKTPLQTERDLGPFRLPEKDPDYPVDYILDGQQRATSIFGVFQTKLQAAQGEDDSWTKIYFDFEGGGSAQDSRFLYLPDDEVDPERHFPVRILLDPPEYRKFLKEMDDKIADEIDQLYRRFTTAKIPVQTFTTDDRTAVAIVFERINRMGVELDTLQLLSAWSWSDEFDLQEQFSDLAEDLEPFGFKSVGEDSDLLLRCCAAIIANDASPNSVINLKGAEVRARFKEVRSGILGAIDFLRTHFAVHSADFLPYSTIIAPLAVFFATDADQSTHPTEVQQSTLRRWIWRTFFTRRYSKRLEQLNQDIVEVTRLRNGLPHNLGEFHHRIDESFFRANSFGLRNVDSKTFILMLASKQPLDFIGGGVINLGNVLRNANKKEFHHLYPKAYLATVDDVTRVFVDSLVNICVLPRASNNRISGSRPSEYRTLLPSDAATTNLILERSLIPQNLFDDNFKEFVIARTVMLKEYAEWLMDS